MQTIDENLSDITRNRSTDLELARRALIISNDNNRIVMEIVLVENRRLVEPLLAARSKNSKEITKLIGESESRCDSEKEKQALSEVKRTREPYLESCQRAIHLLVDERKHDKAETVMVNEILPALLRYHAAWEKFVEFQKEELDVAVKQAQVDHSKARRLASLLIGLAVVLAIVIALFATREAAHEIAARIDAEKEVSKLNAGLEERVMQRTRELTDANERLEDEVRERQLAEKNSRQEAACRKSVEQELQRSEERNRLAMEAARIGYWDLDIIKDEHVWSDTCKALLGVPADSPANYQVLMNSLHPDDRKMMRDEIDGAIQEKRVYDCEFRVVWPDGSVHWRVSRGHAFYNDHGQPTRMTGISMDVDERKHAEERLHLQAAALESAANSILVSDREGTILWVNRAFSDLTGYAAEEVRGRNPRLLMSGTQSKEFYAKLWQTISTGNIWHGEFTNRRKDGSLYEEEQTITPVRSGRGDITHFVAVKQDITERKRSEETLKNSENKYRALFEDSADANWLMNEEGFLDCNSAALQMFGYSAGDRMLLHPADISPPNQPDGTPSRTAADQKIAAAFLNGKERFEWLHQRKNGAVFPSEVCLTALTLSGRPTLLATVRDITERKHAEEGLLFKTALLEAQAETTLDGILAVDESDHIVLANKQFGLHLEIPFELLSTRDDRIVLKHLTDKVEAPDAFIERVKYLNSHRDEKSRDELRFKNGKIFDRYSAPLVDSKRRYRGRIWYFRDITARKLAEERVQFLAYYDALTGLPNRTLLQDRLGKALAGARRRKDKVAILFFDLDRFKDINDSLGHSVGDILLQEVAGRLKTWAREQDTVARVGGDEFLIVLTGLTDVADAAVATERIVNLMTVGFVVQGHPVNVSCSIGVSIFPEHGADVETLIKNADAALYSAKENGRNRFRFFTEDMNAQAVERLTLENSLRLALAQKELFLMYQPQMDIATGRITGLEALLRWQHPDLGLVPPDKFIRIAENSGLIVPIGEWVLRTACSQARKWQDEGVTAVSVAVNVSAVQFRQEGFCEVIRRVLHETGLAPQYLELELTESLLLANADLMLSVVQELKAMGVSLAIDDFGTGYSSFSYLRQFRVSKLKIDRVFIRDVAVNPDDAAITTAIISMAKSLHLKVIAEGVEEEAQMSFLRAHQCDEIQGFYFSKPLVVDKASEKLRGNSPKPQVRAQASGKQS